MARRVRAYSKKDGHHVARVTGRRDVEEDWASEPMSAASTTWKDVVVEE